MEPLRAVPIGLDFFTEFSMPFVSSYAGQSFSIQGCELQSIRG